MAVCAHCEQEMLAAVGCTKSVVPIRIGVEVREYERIRFQGPLDPFRVPDERCHDCNVERGQVHHRRCDGETCPRCRGQLISCDCVAPADHKLTESQWKGLLTMSDDLTEGLRDAGHDDLAEALERKQLAGRLRESGRDDLADQLDRSAEAVQPPSEAEQFLQELKAAATRNTTTVPNFFGGER